MSLGAEIESWVLIWTDIASQGMTLIAGNHKVQGVENMAEFWQEPQNETLLKAIANTRYKLLKLAEKSDELAQLDAIQKLDENDEMRQMFNTELPPAYVTELDSEKFDDIVGWKTAELAVGLETLSTNFHNELMKHYKTRQAKDEDEIVDYFQEFSSDGVNPWTSTLAEDASFEDVHNRAKETIFVHVPGGQMKLCSENVVTD